MRFFIARRAQRGLAGGLAARRVEPRVAWARRHRLLLVMLLAVATLAAPFVGVQSAQAVTYRCPAFKKWEDWIGGARVHAYIDFRASDVCNGRHVKRAYVRLIRQCGPYLDTGRIYTGTAASPSDTRLYSQSAWIFDSVLWRCNTAVYYDYEYF